MARSIVVLSCLLAVLGGCHRPPVEEAPEPGSDDARQFPCVDFHDLRHHLPKSLAGMKAVSDEGSSGRYGEVSVSEAERVYQGDPGKEISIRIVDTTLAGPIAKAIQAAAKDDEAPIDSHEAVGFVRFVDQEHKAEANLLVGGRFVVAVTGRGYDDARTVREVAEGMDLAALALLK